MNGASQQQNPTGQNIPPAALIVSLTDRGNPEANRQQAEDMMAKAREAGAKTAMFVDAEQFAVQAERAGFHQEAAMIRGQKFENTLTNKVKNLTRYSPTVGDVLVAGIVVGGVLLVWEGIRFLLRDTVDLPGFMKFNQANGGPRRVPVAASSR